MEQFDLLDRNRMPTGELMDRGTPEPDNRYRQTIHVAIFNSKGQMLIQQRKSTKRVWPNMWDISVGGCVSAGEYSYQSAERELSEELGIQVDLSNVRPSLTSNFARGFDDHFILNMDIDIKDLKLQETEVQDAKWASLDEILKLIEEEKFVKYFEGFIRLLFEMQNKHYGVIRDFD